MLLRLAELQTGAGNSEQDPNIFFPLKTKTFSTLSATGNTAGLEHSGFSTIKQTVTENLN